MFAVQLKLSVVEISVYLSGLYIQDSRLKRVCGRPLDGHAEILFTDTKALPFLVSFFFSASTGIARRYRTELV